MRTGARLSTEIARNSTQPISEFSGSLARKPERVLVEVRKEGEKQS